MATIRATTLIALALIAAAACGADEDPIGALDVLGDEAITVGSFDFAESVLLAELYSQALEHGGYRVERAFGLGPRELVGPALSAGLIEVVPEYAGTAVTFFSAGTASPTADPATTHRELTHAVTDHRLTALEAAPAENSNAFVVTRETARQYELETLSDLAGVAAGLVLGGPPECPTRPLCQPGLEARYGLSFAEFVALDAGGPATHQALRTGGIDVALLFGTDPELDDFVELADDRRLQPAENVTPLVRVEVLERWGEGVAAELDAVSHHLDTDALRRLNRADAAAAGSADVAPIVAMWRRAEGLA